MRRLLYLWGSLAAGYFAADSIVAAISGRAWRGEAALLTLALVPLLQALLLGYFTRGEEPWVPRLPVQRVARVGVVALALLGALVAALGGLFLEEPLFTLHGEGLTPRLFASLQAGVAAAFAAASALAAHRARNRALALRLALLALGLVGFGLEAALSWLARLSASLAPSAPPLLAWVASHAPLVLGGAALLFDLEQRSQPIAPNAARWYSTAVGLGALAALGSALGFPLRPEVGQPIYTLGTACGFWAVTAVLAALFVWREAWREAGREERA